MEKDKPLENILYFFIIILALIGIYSLFERYVFEYDTLNTSCAKTIIDVSNEIKKTKTKYEYEKRDLWNNSDELNDLLKNIKLLEKMKFETSEYKEKAAENLLDKLQRLSFLNRREGRITSELHGIEKKLTTLYRLSFSLPCVKEFRLKHKIERIKPHKKVKPKLGFTPLKEGETFE